jgi:antitoxin component of RelBE/YafQ-DinJ toxin-antitoxin module
MVVWMTATVTVSAKIDVNLRKKLDELGIKPSETIRRALEREVEIKLKEKLNKEIDEVSAILTKVSKDDWMKAIRESREER